MIIFDTVGALSEAQLLVNDVVQILGEEEIGDKFPMFGVVRENTHATVNRMVPITQGLVVEIMPDFDASEIKIPFLTPEQYGAPCNGVDDDSVATQRALEASITLKLPLVMNRNYTFLEPVTYTGNSDIQITGTGTINHHKSAFVLSGEVLAEVPLATAINDFSMTSIKPSNISSFEEGCLGIIHSSIMCLSTDALSMQLGEATLSGAPSWFGEFFQVNSIANEELKLATPLLFNLYPLTPSTNSGVRTTSTVRRVNPVSGFIGGGIKFNRVGNANTAVEIEYGKDFTVTGRFDAKKLPGVSVVLKRCFSCEVRESSFKLDPSVLIKYGTVNPEAPDYYNFNTVKCTSSQACGVDACRFDNGSQTFDITYDGMPSSLCYMRNCVVTNARHNMATSHGGSYANTFSGNTGHGVWRGIAARCREDAVVNNRVVGFRKFPKSPNTNSDTYGVAISEGFTVGATVNGNQISGFNTNVSINNSSSRGAGFDYNRVTISNNRMSYSYNHIKVANATPTDKSIESGIVISNNQFDSHQHRAISLARYSRSVIIKDNVFLDSSSTGQYEVATDGNCVGIELTGNTFKRGSKVMWVKSITDGDLGEDSAVGAQIKSINNIIRGDNHADSYAYGDGSSAMRPSLGNNFQHDDKGYKYYKVVTTLETLQEEGVEAIKADSRGNFTLDAESLTVVGFGGMTEDTAIDNITAGINGRELTICNPSATHTLTVKNSSSVQTATGADLPILNGTARFVFITGKWRQV